MYAYRRWLLCLTLLWSTVALANNVSRYWPAQSTQSPHYWLAIDSSTSLAQLQQLSEWLPLSLGGQRPYPVNGLAVGLLAATPDAQDRFEPRVLLPPQPLLTEQTWPASAHYRQAALAGPVIIDEASSETTNLYFQLPWLAQWQSASFLTSELSLPINQPVVSGHDYQLALLPLCEPMPVCTHSLMPLWQTQGQLAVDAAVASINLQAGMLTWLGVQGQAWWRLTVALPSSPWQQWSVQQPALWRLGWQQASHDSSGLSKLQNAITSLLFTPSSQPVLGNNTEALSNALAQAKMGLPPASEVPVPSSIAPPTACARHAALLLTDTSEDNAAAELSVWRDLHLAPLPTLSQLLPRQFFSQQLGKDFVFQQAIPGQKRWPANAHFHATDVSESAIDPEQAILSGGLVSAWQQSQSNLLWLTDVAQGMPLQATNERFALGMAAGTAIYYRASEFDQYVFWPDAIGRVLLTSAETGQLLWAWLPTRLAQLRQAVQQQISTAYAAELHPSHWLLWPSNEVAALRPQLRYLIGLIAGEVLALDVSQALSPKQLLQINEGEWGSVSLIPTAAEVPLLLLAAGPEKPQAVLQLYDLSRAELIWSADNQSHVDLQGFWLSPWSSVTTAEGRVRSYGLDTLGQLWRLSTGANKPPRLEKIAQLSPLALSRHDANTLSVSVVLAGNVPLVALVTATPDDHQQLLVFSDELPESSQTELSLSGLPQWPSQSLRWRYQLPANEVIRQPIRWFQHQLIVVTGVQSLQFVCAPLLEQTRIRRIPWRNTQGLIQPDVLDSAEAVVSAPQINAQGELVFVGLNEELKISAPVPPKRIRVKRQIPKQ
ncbi:MAG: hypothetical protein Q8L72_11845 [Moraxellaceae bacterium]|nr:hypothetical protein [Moraxellaceae bacterium]